ncbi:hypothetical protein ES708_19826 [subsurface metagenome]
MKLTDKQFIRIAGHLRDQLRVLQDTRRKQFLQSFDVIIDKMELLHSAKRRLACCHNRHWHTATEKIMSSVSSLLADIPNYLYQPEQAIKLSNIPLPSLKEVYCDLLQADEEFGGLMYHTEGDLLTVTTEPIELDGVYLGPFEIQLHIPSVAEMRCNSIYRIVALEPHPATSNDSVTHPHVSDERLCAGDAEAAINAALSSGRICDFFQLVSSVLSNYNPGSPYVSLENWNGYSCYECGYLANEEDSYTCQGCDNWFCSECVSFCPICDDSFCRLCMELCPVCTNLACKYCMTICPDCETPICRNCYENDECNCQQQEQENEQEQQTTNATEAV